ncbi:ABC transporter substrate-binding protein [Microlunatus elymi]|uniref:ABC transporter substrate-binding protein n=1 Tax=Microlunatus elymi TaxID=2596828 RepID=UPI00143D2FDB|nr:ABC transporter substrate-binding protein [Microlunatus elymi]
MSAPTKPVTITFASWVGDQPAMKKLYAGFHQEYPNITVKFNNIPSDSEQQKLVTMVAGGTAPDVAYMDSSGVADFASRGALVGLDGYISGGGVIKKDDYVKNFTENSIYKGTMYGLPFDNETTGLFFRTDLFKQAGISGPPKTWDELQADAQKLTQPAQKRSGIAIFGPESGYYVQPFVASAGGQMLSNDGKKALMDSPEAVRGAAFYTGLAKYAPADYLNSNSYDGRVAFEHGQVAMYIAGSWFGGSLISEAPNIKGKWATAMIPQDKKCATQVAGDSLVMFDQSKNKDAAWLWMQYLSRPDSLKTWNVGQPDSTELPPLKSLLNDPATFKGKEWLKSFASMMSCQVITQNSAQWGQIQDHLNDELTKVIYGKATAQEAMQDTAKYANQLLAK